MLEINNIDKPATTYRNPRKTNWEKYGELLSKNLSGVKTSIRDKYDLEMASEQLQEVITKSYHETCPETIKTYKSEVTWWNENLSQLRQTTRKLYNSAKRTGDRTKYNQSLANYNKEIRKARTNAWRKLCQEIENTSEAARLQKVLAKDPVCPVGTIKNSDGGYTKPGKETLETLIKTHFPDSGLNEEEDSITPPIMDPQLKTCKEDWRVANQIFTFSRICWAIKSFGAYKSPGPDGIFPALLQPCLVALILILRRLFICSLAAAYIPTLWTQVRVAFIPKPGRDPSFAKSYMPIIL